MFNSDDFDGICAVCFAPILRGHGATVRANGRHFHKSCLDHNPYSYYVKLERSLAKREATLSAKRSIK